MSRGKGKAKPKSDPASRGYANYYAQEIARLGDEAGFSTFTKVWAEAIDHFSNDSASFVAGLPVSPFDAKPRFEILAKAVTDAPGPRSRRDALTKLMAFSCWWVLKAEQAREEDLS